MRVKLQIAGRPPAEGHAGIAGTLLEIDPAPEAQQAHELHPVIGCEIPVEL
jgi:hypothetical protein